ncbi:MAG: sugar phosphate isomerase/epimerase family protein [Candidatus Methylomirabilales bacterium]
MRETLHAYMKVGIVHFMAYPQTVKGDGPIVETVRRIAEDDFFSAIEITTVKEPKAREEVARILEEGHLVVGYGAQPILLTRKLNLNAFESSERAQAVQAVKEAVDEAYTLGAGSLAVLSGPDPGERREEAMRLLVQSLTEICAHAKSKGSLRIVLETFDQKIDKRCLIGPHKDAVKVSAEVRKACPHFGLMLDLSHLPLQGETPQEAFQAARDHVAHIHIGNCVKKEGHPAYGDQHPRFGLPGGENDVPQVAEFLRELFQIGYLGEGKRPIVAFEVKPLPGESSELVIAGAKRTLVEAWSQL